MKTSIAPVDQCPAATKTEIFFPEGVIGFAEHKRYSVVAEKSQPPFVWFEATGEGGPSFIVIDPREFRAAYAPQLSEQDKQALGVSDSGECQFYAIVVVPKDSDRISANLLAPLAINPRHRIGRQVVLQDQEYSVQHYILEELLTA
jgi:flagellar assembly factor FliW